MIGRENIVVRFRITSATLTAQEIETRLGVKPEESTKIGDRLGVFGAVEKTHSFTFVSTPPPSATLDEHIQSMIKRLAPLAAKIGEFGDAATGKMVCTIQRKAIPPIRFGRDDLRWLGVMGAQLEVEVGVIPDAEREALRGAAQKKPGSEF